MRTSLLRRLDRALTHHAVRSLAVAALSSLAGERGIVMPQQPTARTVSAVAVAPAAVDPRQSVLRWARSRHGIVMLLSLTWLVACLIVFQLQGSGHIFVFHAAWLLHAFEQEHLMLAKHFAEHGSLTIRESWYGLPGHASEDGAYLDGRVVPRAAPLIYLIYAVPYLISDTAWLWVTPIFGAACATGVGLIVQRRTRSALAGGLAGVATILTAPVMVAASGLVFDNLIAMTFIVWGVYTLDRYFESSRIHWGVAAGMAFGAALLLRPDYAPAGALACAVAVGHVGLHRIAERRGTGLRDVAGIVSVVLPFTIAGAALLLFNQTYYGDPLQSGYASSVSATGAPVWSGSTDGILNQLRTFDPNEFLPLAHTFLWEIGRAQSLLLLAGVAAIVARRRLAAADAVLLGFVMFTIALHLGHTGAYGGTDAVLYRSPPRYMLPVYVTGIILGFDALHAFGRRVVSGEYAATMLILAGVTLLVAGRGLHEAYGTSYAGLYGARAGTERARGLHNFSRTYPDAVFIGDAYTKALIDRHTIIPRLIGDTSLLPGFVRADLAAGREVFVVETADELQSQDTYSEYHRVLARDGLGLLAVSLDPPVASVVDLRARGGAPVISQLTLNDGEMVSGSVGIRGDAVAPGGVARIDILVDGDIFATFLNAPYSWGWNTNAVADGHHVVTMRLTSTDGRSSDTTVRVTVRNTRPGDPQATLTAPAHDAIVASRVFVRADASDPDHIERVMFYIDGAYAGSDVEAPYGWLWDTTGTPDGRHSVSVMAVDATGQKTLRVSVVQVNNH